MTTIPPLEDRVIAAVGKLSSSFKSGGDSSNIAQQICLLLEAERADQDMTGLSETLGKSTSCLTGLVDRIEKVGWAYRERQGDRRKWVLRITEEGQAVLNRYRLELKKEIGE